MPSSNVQQLIYHVHDVIIQTWAFLNYFLFLHWSWVSLVREIQHVSYIGRRHFVYDYHFSLGSGGKWEILRS